MLVSILRSVFFCSAFAVFGSMLGSIAGVVMGAGPCLAFDSAYFWGGAALGAGIGAVVVFSDRSDPRAFNRQDPPDPPAG